MMIMRSASTPILNSRIHLSKESSLEPEIFHQFPKTRSLALTASCCSSFSSSPISSHDGSIKKMTKALSETDLRHLSVLKKKPINKILDETTLEEEEDEKTALLGPCLSLGSSLLNEESDVRTKDDGLMELLGAGGIGSGGGSDSGDGGNAGFCDSNSGNDSTDVYYRKMIEANPGNSLLLGNYAKFLKEVRADFVKAEEYCGRAILVNPNDGNILSMYADLIWERHKDSSRAEAYFNQAVKATPDDCFVLASYARFLWDAEEDEEGQEAEEMNESSPPTLFHGKPSTLAAAS